MLYDGVDRHTYAMFISVTSQQVGTCASVDAKLKQGTIRAGIAIDKTVGGPAIY